MANKDRSIQIKYPYARLKGMQDFMSFLLEPEWKPPLIDKALMKMLGIARGKESEAIYGLKFLGIIDQTGVPTEVFDELKTDYQGTMNRIVREKYAQVFSLIPTRMVNQQRLVNFFETTLETAEYQAKLFVWFCEQAGIALPNVEKRFHRSRFDNKELHTS